MGVDRERLYDGARRLWEQFTDSREEVERLASLTAALLPPVDEEAGFSERRKRCGELWSSGASITEIALVLGFSRSSVYRYVKSAKTGRPLRYYSRRARG